MDAFSFRKSGLFSTAIGLLYALVIAGYPLVSNVTYLLGIQSRSFSIGFRIGVFALSLLIIVFIGIRRRRIYSGVLWLPLIIFWSLYITRLWFDTLIEPQPLKLPWYEYYAFSIGGCLVPMLAFMVLPSEESVSKAFRLTLIFSTTALVLLLFNVLFFDDGTVYWKMVGRLGTEYFNPISVGHLSASLILLAIFYLSRFWAGGVYRNTAMIAILAFGTVVLALAASKGPILSLLISLIAFVWGTQVRRRGNLFMFMALMTLLVLLLVAVLSILYAVDSPLIARFIDLGDGKDLAVNERLMLLGLAWQLFSQSPLFGEAIEIVKYSSYPHNLIIESFFVTGVLGGISFLAVLIAAIFYAIKIIGADNEYAWLGLLFIQYMVGGLVSGALYGATVFWPMLGAVISLSYFSRLIEYEQQRDLLRTG